MVKGKRTKGLFWKVYAVGLAVVTLIVAVLLFIGYRVMIDYDDAQGGLNRTASKIAEEIAGGTYDRLFEHTENAEAPLVFEREAYTAHIRELVSASGGVLTARKGFSTDRYTRPVYDILAGDTRIASVHFILNEGKSKYGFDTFSVEKVVPVTDGHYAVSVLVPENAELYLNNDIFVGSRWIDGEPVLIEASPNQLLLSASQEEGSALVPYTKYTVDGLMEALVPKVVYTESGTEAELFYDTERKVWRCKNYEITISAPSNFKVQVNGVTISEDPRFVQEDGIAIKEISVSQRYAQTAVNFVKYSVGGFDTLDHITVSATAFDGTEANVVYNESTGEYVVSYQVVQDQVLAEYQVSRDFLLTRAREYAKFVTNDGNLWDNVLPYVLEGTEVYTTFRDFWLVFSRHDSYWIENETIAELCPYGEDLFSARVTLDYWVKGFANNPQNVKMYPVDVTFYYVKVNGNWKIVDWDLAGAME